MSVINYLLSGLSVGFLIGVFIYSLSHFLHQKFKDKYKSAKRK